MEPCGDMDRQAFQGWFTGGRHPRPHHPPGSALVRGFILLSWLFILFPIAAWGQIRLGVEHGQEALFGASQPRHGADAATAAFRPYRPTWWGIRVEGPWSGVRPALTLRRSVPDLALEGDALTLVQHGPVTTITGLQADAMVPLGHAPGGTEWRAAVGGLLERWVFVGTPARWRLGPVVGLSLALPLADAVELSVGGSAGALPVSPFRPEELPDGLEPRGAWRTALRGSLNLRF